jgi:homogentisate 1,2-dioxygenase
VNFIF